MPLAQPPNALSPVTAQSPDPRDRETHACPFALIRQGSPTHCALPCDYARRVAALDRTTALSDDERTAVRIAVTAQALARAQCRPTEGQA